MLRRKNGPSRYTQPPSPIVSGPPIKYYVLLQQVSMSSSKDTEDRSTVDKVLFRTVESNERFWAEEVSFENRQESDGYRDVKSASK